MRIDYHGGDSDFFDNGFFGPDGPDLDFTSTSSTEVVAENATTGYEVTFTGSGFTFNSDGITGGTIETISIANDSGTVVVDITNVSWDAVAFQSAIFAITDGNFVPINELIAMSDPVYVDASDSTTMLSFGADNWNETRILSSMDFTGSAYGDVVLGASHPGDDVIRGGGGNDMLAGGRGDDTIRGGAGNDLIFGNLGDNDVFGGGGRDTVYGHNGSDRVVGNGGKDFLFGKGGADDVIGGGGNDKMNGGGGQDFLNGGRGADKLIGGGGDDELRGGAQADRFIFKGKFGHDTVLDFNTALSNEVIDLRAVGAITDYADLTANHLSEVDGNAVITVGNKSITLEGVAVADLASDDFLI